ncbi:MAG: hypothetical protein ACKV2V_20195 [Blastocatellia bacterium]
MAGRPTDREILLSRLTHLSDGEIRDILGFLGLQEPAQLEAGDDELLAALSAARENRRARQVLEWEAVRRRAEKRTAFPAASSSTSR